jgi:hypothetical protein
MKDFKDYLRENRSDILERWLKRVQETYPVPLSGPFSKEKDRFANPVAAILTEGMERLYDGFLAGIGPDQLSEPLERILEIRAVQDLSPSRAAAILILLKKAVRQKIAEHPIEGNPAASGWVALEVWVDELTLSAFDHYARCRERIFEILISEIRKDRDRMRKLLERS